MRQGFALQCFSLEYEMVTSYISLYLSLSRPNFAVPLNKGVNDIAFVADT